MNTAADTGRRYSAGSHPNFVPTLSDEELAEVYRAAKTTNLGILRDAAVQMFPERFREQPPQLYAHAGGGTAFRNRGVMTRP